MRTTKESIELLLNAVEIQKASLESQQEEYRTKNPEVGLNRWLDVNWRSISEGICYLSGKIQAYKLALTCFPKR